MKKLVALVICASLAACGDSPQAESGPSNASRGAEAPAAGAAGSEAANAADSVKARQSHYKQIGAAMKGINDELKKEAPSVPAIQGHAATIHRFAPQVQGWFPTGSGSEAGLKTEARAEIWSKPEEFAKRTQAFVTAAAAFNQTAQGGDVAAIRAGVKSLGGTCKGCHDEFRVED